MANIGAEFVAMSTSYDKTRAAFKDRICVMANEYVSNCEAMERNVNYGLLRKHLKCKVGILLVNGGSVLHSRSNLSKREEWQKRKISDKIVYIIDRIVDKMEKEKAQVDTSVTGRSGCVDKDKRSEWIEKDKEEEQDN